MLQVGVLNLGHPLRRGEPLDKGEAVEALEILDGVLDSAQISKPYSCWVVS